MRLRSTVLAAVSAVTLTAIAPAVSAQAAPDPEAQVFPAAAATSQVIVTYDHPADRARINTSMHLDGVDASVARNFENDKVVVDLGAMTAPDELNAIMQDIANQPDVVSVTADPIMKTDTNDPLWDDQWPLTDPDTGAASAIDLEDAWKVTTGSDDVYVAVLDTGIVDHPDLNSRWVGGYDFVHDVTVANDGNGRDADPHDPGDWIDSNDQQDPTFTGCPIGASTWHGTHVAGTIGAAANDNFGVAGINQVSKIVPVRVLGKCYGFSSDIADAIRWSAGLPVAATPPNPHKADVINMSLGGGGNCDTPAYSSIRDAVSDAVAAGVSVVVAAGNNDADAKNNTPASCDGVITVAATGQDGDKAFYSAYGDVVEVSAPGGDSLADDTTVLSTIDKGDAGPMGADWAYYQGTSMAAPHVAGVASLVKSANPTFSPAAISKALMETARPYPTGSSCENRCGAGMIDASAAVRWVNDEVENLARSGTATQSSVFRNQVASRAIDGTTTSRGGINGSNSHTRRETNAYWDLQLDASASIDNIVVWNRVDCCANRIKDFWVFASNTPFASDDPSVLANDPNVQSTRIEEVPRPSVTIDMSGFEAKYVRVQLNGTNFLHLAEVEVFGTRTEVPKSEFNLAPLGTATQSSTWGGQAAAQAIDGDTNGYGKQSSSHTKREDQPYWDLRLQRPASVDSVVVWRRTGCCESRIQDFWVFVSDTPFTSNDPGVLAAQPGVSATRIQGFADASTRIDLADIPGEYVRVQLNGTNFLQLAEVQVFGEERALPAN